MEVWSTDKIKRNFFQAVIVPILLYGCTSWTLTKRIEKNRRELHKNSISYIDKILEVTSYEAAVVWPPTSNL